MPIDECKRTFFELATDVLPKRMAEMTAAMKQPVDLRQLCLPTSGILLMRKRFGSAESGCFVLLREGKAFYVGISRRVLQRLKQHVQGRSHNDASLAYRMATEKLKHKFTRDEAMNDAAFREAFDEAKKLLNGCSVAIVPIENPVELYSFEAYCAMELDPGEWNSFGTP